MDEKGSVQSSADAFQKISNEFRVSILHELAQSDNSMQFSELLEALGGPDSGRLNYHLNQLTGTYIDRDDGEYWLTIQGAKIVSSILASRYINEESTYSVTVEGCCYNCRSNTLILTQSGQQAVVQCQACNSKQFRKSVSTALWKHRSETEVPEALDRIVWTELELAVNHVCSYCHSTMTPRVAENKWDSDLYGFYDFGVLAVYDCELCTNWKLAPYGLIAWLHPDVQSFHEKFEVSTTEVKCWQIDQGVDPQYTVVESTDPYEITVNFPIEDAECSVTFNNQNEVVHVVRE